MSEGLKTYWVRRNRLQVETDPVRPHDDVLVIVAADVERVFDKAKDVAILLRAYIAMRTHPGCLENDPDYVTATRLLAELEGKP